ncbi:NusG domain II-containing protein [Spirochaetia bacterium 38H-sp]|uniref:NusG domain II-containing protein n=1 Tax=Rarispira pelagica TaxID=3141764 RepID=A0ABU9U9H9_9SPIR
MDRAFSLQFTVMDIFVVALAFCIVVFSVYSLSLDNSGKKLVHIESEKGSFLYPLDDNREISVSGPLGETLIKIEDGYARIIESPCPDKLCIAMGRISSPGQWVACLPNRIFVRITGQDIERTVDAGSF